MKQRLKVNFLLVYAITYILFLYGPVFLIVLFSFNEGIYVTFPIAGFTLDWYKSLLDNPEILRTLKNSLVVASVVSLISTVLGVMGAKALTHYSFPGRGFVAGISAIPLVVPAIILGIGLLIIARQILGIQLSLITVGIGHILICIPFSLFALISRMEGFDSSLEEASLDLGENACTTFWKITFPLSFPGIVASLLLCFTVSFDEFVIAFFLTGNEATLPIYVYSQLRFPDRLPSVLALGSCVLVFSALIVVIAELLRQSGTPSRTRTVHEA